MSYLLEIPDALYKALQAAADAYGTTPLGWIAAHLQPAVETGNTHDESAGIPKTLAELFAGRVGRIRSGGTACFSEACGDKFTDYVEAKRKAGHL